MKRKRKYPVFLISLWIIMFLGGLWLSIAGLNNAYQKLNARDWKPVLAQVTHLSTKKRPRATYLEYTPKIRYSYFIGSKNYTGSSTLPELIDLNTIRKRYRKGARIQVFYNPESPRTSIVFRNINSKDISLLIYGVIIFILLIPFTRYIGREKKRKPDTYRI